MALKPNIHIVLLLLLPFALIGQEFPMDGNSFNTCSGIFTDSGGNSAAYSPGENFTTTICPDSGNGSYIQLNFTGVDLTTGDLLCFYDDDRVRVSKLLACSDDFRSGNPFIIQATANNPTGCITVTFNSDNIDQGQGWEAQIKCRPACQTIVSEILQSSPNVHPVDTGWIDMCPGEKVFLKAKGNYPQNNMNYSQSDASSVFEWNMGDGTILRGSEIAHRYTKPGGYTVQLRITDREGCENTNFLDQRIRVASNPNFVIANDVDPTICALDTISLKANLGSVDLNAEVSVLARQGEFQNGGIRSDSIALPDGTGATYTTNISISGFAPGQKLNDVNDLVAISINMEHSWMRDMEISIKCPNGQSVLLHDHPGNIGGRVLLGNPVQNDNIIPIQGVGMNYNWTPNAQFGTWLEYANSTFTIFGSGTLPEGDYSSKEPLSDLVGCPLNGDWSIDVVDLWPQDNGFIFSWGLNFNPAIYPNLETFTPDLLTGSWDYAAPTIFQSMDSITAAPGKAGLAIFNYEVQDQYRCNWDTSLNFDVLPEIHRDCANCDEKFFETEDTLICEPTLLSLSLTPIDLVTKTISFEAFPDAMIGMDNHPPANPLESKLNINSLRPLKLSNAIEQIERVCFDLTTDYAWDIQAALRAPSGEEMILTTNNGGAGSYKKTCFTPKASKNITTGIAPFTGDFIPEGDWNKLNGSDINGDWTLLVGDAAGIGQFGTLNQWSISFQHENEVRYQWDNTQLLSCNTCLNPTADIKETTVFTVSASDASDCQQAEEVTVEVFSAAAPQIHCEPSNSGSLSFTWDPVPGASSYEININQQGWIPGQNFSFTGDNFNDGDQVQIEVRAFFEDVGCYSSVGFESCFFRACELETTVDKQNVSCFGRSDGSFTIHATGGDKPYQFSLNGASFQLDSTFTNMWPGTFTVIVEDGLLCRDTAIITITQPDLLLVQAIVIQNVQCNGENDGIAEAQVSGGDGNYFYAWNDNLGQTGQTATTLEAGNYSVTVQDGNSCTEIASVQITQPSPLIVNIMGQSILCKNDSTGTANALANGGTGDYTYLWNDSDQQTTQEASFLPAGTYTVTVTDENGCEANNFTTLTEPSTALDLSTMQTNEGCDGSNDGAAVVNVSGGTGFNYRYNWSSGQTTQFIQNLPKGTYYISVTDDNQCLKIDTIEITELAPIELSFAANQPTCYGASDGQVAVTNARGGSGIFAPSSFFWNTGERAPFIENLVGDRNYWITVTDNLGCEGIDTFYLEQPDPVSFDFAVSDVLCFGGSDGVAEVIDFNSVHPVESYSWDSNAGNATTSIVNTLGEGRYFVTVTDTAGCEGIRDVTISQPNRILLSFDVEDNDCYGGESGIIEVSVSGGTPFNSGDLYQVNWPDGSTGYRNENLFSGVYEVTVTDANNCEVSDTTSISNADPISVQIETEPASCFGDGDGKITIDATGGVPPYQYSTDDVIYSGSNILIGFRSGTYDVYIRDKRGCINIEKAYVSEPSELIVDAGPDIVEINLGESTQLNATSMNGHGIVLFQWIPPYEGTLSCTLCPDPIANPENSTLYRLVGQDENGCESEDLLSVRVLKERTVMVPTGFTPNNDGSNDRLQVHGIANTRVKTFQVYDRWGELIFEDQDFMVNDPNRGWDGVFRGKEMNTGVYLWYVEAEFIDGVVEFFKGQSTLIR